MATQATAAARNPTVAAALLREGSTAPPRVTIAGRAGR
jgi:hypothetical protein